MSWFQNRKTSHKIAVLVLMVTASMLLVGGIGYRQLKTAAQDMNAMYENAVLPIGSLNQLQNASRSMERGLMQYAGASAAESQETIAQAMEDQRAELAQLLETIEAGSMDQRSMELMAVIKESLGEYTEEMVPFLQQIVQGGPPDGQQNAAGPAAGAASPEASPAAEAPDPQQAAAPGGAGGTAETGEAGMGGPGDGQNAPGLENGQEQLAKLSDAIQELTVYNTELAKEATLQVKETTARASRNILLLVGASAALAAALGWWISRQLALPIKRISSVAEQVAAGNLQVAPLQLQRTDELGELAGSVDRMLASLKGLICRLSESANVVGSSSRVLLDQAVRTEAAGQAISSAVHMTDEGARQQSLGVVHMTGTLQEMAAAIRLTAASGEAAASASASSAERANEGLTVIGQAMTDMEAVSRETQAAAERMAELDGQAAHISEIAGFITQIAGQTNLLALNASIEAARAGEHGKGFAVVAEEVRKLAEEARSSSERATEAVKLLRKETQEAAAQMENNARRAEAGKNAALAAGAMFKEIAAEVDSVSGLMTDLSAAVEEAFAGSEEIVTQAEGLRDIADRSVALSEKAAGQAEETLSAMREIRRFSERLEQESTGLSEAMSAFSL